MKSIYYGSLSPNESLCRHMGPQECSSEKIFSVANLVLRIFISWKNIQCDSFFSSWYSNRPRKKFHMKYLPWLPFSKWKFILSKGPRFFLRKNMQCGSSGTWKKNFVENIQCGSFGDLENLSLLFRVKFCSKVNRGLKI